MSRTRIRFCKLDSAEELYADRPQSVFAARFIIFSAISILLIDLSYKLAAGITFQTRESCVLHSTFPKWTFLLYENLIELFLIVIVGVFAATVVERYFLKVRRVLPRNCFTAFIYASVIPICSCSAIPFIKTMENKIPYRALITFVIAAPLLNPYIIMVSITVLGYKYAVLRIVCSLVLAVSTGYIVELFHKRENFARPYKLLGCGGQSICKMDNDSIFITSMNIIRKIIPFILVAGVLSFLFEMVNPGSWLQSLELDGGILGTAVAILVGVPIYFCNGADVLFLKPFIHHGAISAGAAMAFSLTSTSICISSMAMLIKFTGKKTAVVILISIIVVTILLSLIIQMLPVEFYSNMNLGSI